MNVEAENAYRRGKKEGYDEGLKEGFKNGQNERFCYREQYDKCAGCEPDAVWERFWKDIILNENGEVDIEQLKKELADFHHMMEQIPVIYMRMTGGMLSKTGYWAEQILSLNNQEIDKAYQSGYDDGQEDLKAEEKE